MSQFGNRLNVADVARRVADGLAEDRAGRLVDQRGDIAGAFTFGETRFDSVPP